MLAELGVFMREDVMLAESPSSSVSSTTACRWLSDETRGTWTPSETSDNRGPASSLDEASLSWFSAEGAAESSNNAYYKTTEETLENSPSRRIPQTRSKGLSAALLLFVAAVPLTILVGSWRLARKSESQIPAAPLVEERTPKRKSPNTRPKLTIPLVVHDRGRHPSEPETQTVLRSWGTVHMPVDSVSLQIYEDELNTAFAQLEKTWERTPEASRKAFVEHHLPSVDGRGPSPAPFAVFHRHAEALRAIQRPAEAASASEKNAYATRLRLVTSIFKAASSRLSSLIEMENFCRVTGIGSIVIGCEASELPSPDALSAQTADLVTFDDFLGMMNGKPPSQASEKEKTSERKIPKVLAEMLLYAVQGHDLQVCYDSRQHEVYLEFLKAVGSEIPEKGYLHDRWALPLSPGNRPFHTSAFKFVLSQFEKWRTEQVHSIENVEAWASNWTVKGVLQLLRDLEGMQTRGLKEKVRMKEEAAELLRDTGQHSVVPVHDLYALAVALL